MTPKVGELFKLRKDVCPNCVYLLKSKFSIKETTYLNAVQYCGEHTDTSRPLFYKHRHIKLGRYNMVYTVQDEELQVLIALMLI